MAVLPVHRFDLADTLGSGQAFHWLPHEGGFLGAIGDTPVFLRQPTPSTLEVTEGAESAVLDYLGLNHDFEAILASFPADDAALGRAIAHAPGLRVMAQPVWECLATFITSSMKQVAHIAAISHTLRRRYGQPVRLGPHTVHTYPTPEALASAGEAALRDCALGYRAKFLVQTAAAVAEGRLRLELLADPAVSDDEALAHLLSAPGVGPKVASCVLLFAGRRHGFFPVDVWIERMLRELYFPRARKLTTARLTTFAHRHFGPWRGWAQQFLFHHARTGGALEGS